MDDDPGGGDFGDAVRSVDPAAEVLVSCSICSHPAHEGHCSVPLTEEVSEYHKGMIFSRIETVGTCACGLAASLAAMVTDEECF